MSSGAWRRFNRQEKEITPFSGLQKGGEEKGERGDGFQRKHGNQLSTCGKGEGRGEKNKRRRPLVREGGKEGKRRKW